MNNKDVFQLNEKQNRWVDRTLGGMTLEEKVGQVISIVLLCILSGISSGQLFAAEGQTAPKEEAKKPEATAPALKEAVFNLPFTFKDDRVVKALGEMLVVKVDAERYMEQAKALGVESVPAILVVEPDTVAAGVPPADSGREGGTPAPTANGFRVLSSIEAQDMMQPETLLPKLAVALPAARP